MSQPNDFMKHVAQESDAFNYPPEIPTDRPMPARIYGLLLGSKDNFEVDRQAAAMVLKSFPETVDFARENRLFLYRAVRFLAEEVGITQFLDLGSGLPTDQNVHQVAQQVNPDARVVYVDNDPIVLAHARALLVENASTTVIQADLTDTDAIVAHPETQALIDFSQPVGVLMFSVPHLIPDDDAARHTVHSLMDKVPSGSHLALSQVVSRDAEARAAADQIGAEVGVHWKVRAPEDVDSWVTHLEAVDPGVGDINDWRPDPDQPPLPEAHPAVNPFVGASAQGKRGFEHGGVFRKP